MFIAMQSTIDMALFALFNHIMLDNSLYYLPHWERD
jgi:hypothetical protein